MKVIPVQIGRPIKGYSSAAEAISAAKNNPLQPKARADAERLAGRTFVGGRAAPSRWSLEFSGSWYVHVECCNDEVVWSVTQSPPMFEGLAEPYALLWRSGTEGEINPSALFAARAGVEFQNLWVNEAGFYVYFRGRAMLAFHAVRSVDDQSGVLAIGEEG